MNLQLESKLALVPINFFCAAPNAQSVYLIGDFNDWNRTSHPMERQTDGCWFLQVPLARATTSISFSWTANRCSTRRPWAQSAMIGMSRLRSSPSANSSLDKATS